MCKLFLFFGGFFGNCLFQAVIWYTEKVTGNYWLSPYLYQKLVPSFDLILTTTTQQARYYNWGFITGKTGFAISGGLPSKVPCLPVFLISVNVTITLPVDQTKTNLSMYHPWSLRTSLSPLPLPVKVNIISYLDYLLQEPPNSSPCFHMCSLHMSTQQPKWSL